jgi:hypothetical protein
LGISTNIKGDCHSFHPGKHAASRTKQFVPIIDQLVELHKKGYVHGDIRAFNTVFSDEEDDQGNSKGWLIDFDSGGKVGEAKYPIGYVSLLDDGHRMGEGGELITKI